MPKATSSGGTLHSGLTRKNPAGRDSSMDTPTANVADGAVRTGVAPTPKTLGPRTA